VTAALAVRARRVKLLKVISTLWCREKWLFALVGGFVALLGHGLLRLLIALGCAAGIANVLQAVTTLGGAVSPAPGSASGSGGADSISPGAGRSPRDLACVRAMRSAAPAAPGACGG
jgi:hypothetical protein